MFEALIWVFVIILLVIIAKMYEKQNPQPMFSQPSQPQQLQCKRCGNYNIMVTMNQYMQQGTSQTIHQKRSLADRTAYNAGRGTMNMMTMGIWGAFTPKRGKYKEITHTQSRTINQKVAICQYCGFSWKIK